MKLEEKCYQSLEKNLDIERIKELEIGENFFDSDFQYHLGKIKDFSENDKKMYSIEYDYLMEIGGISFRIYKIWIWFKFGYPEYALSTAYGLYEFQPSPSERQWLLAHVLINLKK